MEIRKSLISNGIVLLEPSTSAIGLNEKELRKLILWVWKNKPEIIRDIVCEECPEHTTNLEKPL